VTDAAVLARIELGTFPDWLAAFGTAAALAFALVLFARDQEDRRRAQASRVVCWLVVEPTTSSWTPATGGQTTVTEVGEHLEVVLHNGSGEPVFDCRIQVDLEPPVTVTTTPGGATWQLTLTERMLPPGQTQRPLWDLHESDLPYTYVWMLFTDANNQRWQRNHTGRLSRLLGPAQRSDASPRVGPGALWHGPRR
jgi:hypothetical protein